MKESGNNIGPVSYNVKLLFIVDAIIFFLWPVGSLISSFKHRNYFWAKNIFWLFCIFFGATFITTEGFDSAATHNALIDFRKTGIELKDLLPLLYSEKSTYVDIVQPLLLYIISKFTDNQSVLFAIYGLIFGYFYSRNLWFVLDKIQGKIPTPIFIFILTFALICPIWLINGFRMWAATHIFIFGLLPYLIDGKKNRLWWSFLSIFFHFSFVFPVLILIGYILLKNKVVFYFIFFVVTSFISEINLENIRGLFIYLPNFLQSRIVYTSINYSETIQQAMETASWFIIYSEKLFRWLIYAFIVLVFFTGRYNLRKSPELLNLFSFGLWMFAWANLARLIPSGGRFIVIATSIMTIFIIFYLLRYNNLITNKIIYFISLPILLLFISVSIRIGSDFFGLFTILGNPVIAILHFDRIPLIDFVKELL